MNVPEIQYQLHDSLIYHAESGPRREVRLEIALYDIYYKDHADIEIRFGGIFNYETCERFVRVLKQELLDDRGCTWRIDAFHYDVKQPSHANNLFFYLKVDHLEGLQIHCAKFGITTLEQKGKS